MLTQKKAEKVVGYFFLPEEKNTHELILLSQQGRIKRLPLSELNQLGNRGLALIKFKDADELSYVCLSSVDEEIAIATTGGRILRFKISDELLSLMGRNAQGNQALRLRYGEHLAGCVTTKAQDYLVLITQLGYAKRLPVNSLRITKLGEIGTTALQFSTKTDNLAGIVLNQPSGKVALITNQQRRLILSAESVGIWGKDGVGDRLVKLKSEESIVLVVGC